MTHFIDAYEKAGSPHPMPSFLKWDAIVHYQRRNLSSIFVETGMYKAETTLVMAKHFDACYTIEVSKSMIDRLVASGCPANVFPLLGRSYEVLPTLLPRLPGRRLFWLDAHGDTWGRKLGGKTEQVPACSLLAELDVVFANQNPGDVILVDDADIFGTYGWPPLKDVIARFEKSGRVCRQEALILVCEIPI
jgi:hypothetical protein